MQDLPDNVSDNGNLRERTIADVAVVGRRGSLADALAATLFAAVMASALLSTEFSVVLVALVPVVLLNLWATWMAVVRPPRVAISDNAFTWQHFSTYRTPASNVANVELHAAKTVVTFANVSEVLPAAQGKSLADRFAKHGRHLDSPPGAFSLEQVNSLRATLGLAPQPHDRLADFNSALSRLTPRVVVTPAIVAANLILFGAMTISHGGVFQPQFPTMIAWGANFGPLTCSGQSWRLITSVFLHFGALHLLANMYVLRRIGPVVERLTGNIGFALAYLTAGFFGSVASVLWHPATISAGASGAVFGVFGVLLGYVLLQRRSLPPELVKEHRATVAGFVVLNVALGLGVAWIDQAAHLGGFVTGCLCGLVLGCDLATAAQQRFFRNVALAAVSGLSAGAALMLLPARSADLRLLSVRTDEVDKAAVAQYQKLVAEMEAGRLTPAAAAQQIDKQIVPQYAELASAMAMARPTENNEQQRHQTVADYIRLRQQAWELTAAALANDSLVTEGQAIEKFEAAQAKLASLRPASPSKKGRTDLRAEVAVFAAAEARVFEKHDAIRRQLVAAEISAASAAELIEQRLLPDWRQARERMETAAQNFLADDKLTADRAQSYMRLIEQAWLLEAAGLREGDEEKLAASRQTHETAQAAAQAIWGTPKVDDK